MQIQETASVSFDPSDPLKSAASDVVIPAIDRLETFAIEPDVLANNSIVGFNSRDIRSRPFNLLRSQVTKRMRAEGWKLLGITSATPAAGKSFLAANMAAAMSQLSDTRVFLFDLDLRRASLAENFGMQGDVGLTEYLQGDTADLSSFGRRMGEVNLAVFPCFRSGVNSAELFAGEQFQTLMNGMRALPDDSIAVCDLPPVFANDDAMMIAQSLDAYILVLEEGVTTKKQIRDAMRLLSPTPCLGTVLNRFDGGFGDQYGYAYGGKYDKYYGD
ncbi:CpsD/CapB family tyrosine-protein kinase [Sphingobium boeckii]|uniref:Mrp family chromosome partitioning ATPase n=1 Tax=Sphingobium boeckii TaxID=1082345 RepID=A0A7W9AJI7_9SPHN|nr:CpsD/CapB family tyrosine-protein kinase [Sphingobium boeckii]MBB5686621.1 Mrp family chromosome partitioning ATPase [Sphingobium boeckii]